MNNESARDIDNDKIEFIKNLIISEINMYRIMLKA